jgi:hypothetical protein
MGSCVLPVTDTSFDPVMDAGLDTCSGFELVLVTYMQRTQTWTGTVQDSDLDRNYTGLRLGHDTGRKLGHELYRTQTWDNPCSGFEFV